MPGGKDGQMARAYLFGLADAHINFSRLLELRLQVQTGQAFGSPLPVGVLFPKHHRLQMIDPPVL